MKSLTVTALAVSLAAISGCAQAGQSGSDIKKADVEQIIQDYLMANPEIIRDAWIELDKREKRASILTVSDALFKDPRDISIGCLLYTSPSPRDATLSRMPSSA